MKTCGELALLFPIEIDASPKKQGLNGHSQIYLKERDQDNIVLFLRPRQYYVVSETKAIYNFISHLQNTEDVRVGGSDEIMKEVVGQASHDVNHKARLRV